MVPLAYHADDAFVRWWLVLAMAGAVLAIVLTVTAARRVRDRPGPFAFAPVLALSLVALAALLLLAGLYAFAVLVALLPLLPGVVAVSGSGGRRVNARLALGAFLAALVAFAFGASALAACVVTDGCLH